MHFAADFYCIDLITSSAKCADPSVFQGLRDIGKSRGFSSQLRLRGTLSAGSSARLTISPFISNASVRSGAAMTASHPVSRGAGHVWT